MDDERYKVASKFRSLPVEDLGEGLVSGVSSIRIKGKAWALRHQGETYYFDTPTIDVVILARSPKTSRAYYPGQYSDEAEGRAPVCSSVDGENIDPDVPEPQAKCCSVCPRNEWIGPEGSRKKECQDHRRMAVLLLPEDTKRLLGAPLYGPVFLKIPPGSFPNLKKYGAFLKDRNIPLPSCVTKLGFASPDVSLFAITFEIRQMLSDSEWDTIEPLIGGTETRRLIGEAKVIHETAEEEPPFDPPKKVETGLVAAFGAKSVSEQEIIPPKRGRPAGSKNKPKEASAEDNGGRVSGFAVTDVDTRSTNAPSKTAGAFRTLDPQKSKDLDARVDAAVKSPEEEVDSAMD